MPNILITGGTGLIGTALTKILLERGHHVRHLSRTKSGDEVVGTYTWDVEKGHVQEGVLEGIDTIVHLAGAPIITKKWTPERMRVLELSRAGAAKLLLEQSGSANIKTFISASGINYYGTLTSDHIFTETDLPGDDPVARLTVAWENGADRWDAHARVVKLRTPMVLAKRGGALKELAAPVRWGVGSPLGTGKQWMPWIHVDDLVECYIRGMEDDTMQGAYNAVAGEHMQNAEFMRSLAKALKRPFFLPNVPAFVLKIMLGERASLVLKGSRASGEKLNATGHQFFHSTLDQALKDLLR